MSEAPNEEVSAYDPKAQVPFSDPVVRCASCNTLILSKTLKGMGCCHKCGNRRVTNVRVMNDKEMAGLKEMKIDPAFLALFEGVEDVATVLP